MILTAPELLLLRERPHRTELYLSIYKPTTIMSCQVTGSVSKGEYEIPYDTVTTGTYTDVLADMTMLVGTNPGESDIGKIRVREATATEFIVAANNDINWQNNLYLTILNYIDIWPIYQKIIIDPADDENIIVYKDYDIEYIDQNEVLGSFPCAGPHRAAFLEPGTGSNLYYTADGTTNVNGETGTYSWEFEGGNPATSSAETPGYVSYDTPGHYRTSLIVSGTVSGCSDITHRFVSIYDRSENGHHTPILKWELSGLSGSRAEGGYNAQVKVWEHIDDIQDNALVVIFADDWYGNTQQSLGGNAKNNSKIVFVGYIIKGTIQYNYRDSSAEFDIGSVTEMMRQGDGFGLSCDSVETPSNWFEIQDMNISKALYHYLRWHSTILKTTDFEYTGDNRRKQYFDTDRASMFDAIDNFLRVCMLGELVTDRQGKLWAEINVGATHDATTVIDTTMALTNQDWMGEPSIEERIVNERSYLEMGGVSYDGPATGTFSTFMSESPGVVPAYRGEVERIQGLTLINQLQSNELVGDVFAYTNAKYTVSMQLAGNYRNIDIAPKELCKLNILHDDTVRGIVFTNKPFHPISMNWEWSAERAFLCPSAVFNEVTTGIAGETVPIPVVPPDDGFQVPSIVIPSMPAFSFPFIPTTKTYTWVINNVATGGIPGPRLASNHIVFRIDAYIVGGTSATFNIEERSIIGTAGSNLLAADLVAVPGGASAIAFIDPLVEIGNWLWLDISAKVGTISKLVVTLTLMVTA